MPEGPEIRRAADRLEAVLKGQPLLRVYFKFPQLKQYEPLLQRSRVEALETRGKALLTHFDSGWTLYTHNQLYGLWQCESLDEPPHATRELRVALHTDRQRVCLYSASDISLHTRDTLAEHPFLKRVGPDVLQAGLSAQTVVSRMQLPRFAGKALPLLLLDQGFIAGVGNYLRSEILFAARLHPDQRPLDLSEAKQRALAKGILQVSKLSYRSDGVTHRLALTARGSARVGRSDPGFEQHRFAVFERAGLSCYACEHIIQRVERTGRRLYFCPRCQSR